MSFIGPLESPCALAFTGDLIALNGHIPWFLPVIWCKKDKKARCISQFEAHWAQRFHEFPTSLQNSSSILEVESIFPRHGQRTEKYEKLCPPTLPQKSDDLLTQGPVPNGSSSHGRQIWVNLLEATQLWHPGSHFTAWLYFTGSTSTKENTMSYILYSPLNILNLFSISLTHLLRYETQVFTTGWRGIFHSSDMKRMGVWAIEIGLTGNGPSWPWLHQKFPGWVCLASSQPSRAQRRERPAGEGQEKDITGWPHHASSLKTECLTFKRSTLKRTRSLSL